MKNDLSHLSGILKDLMSKKPSKEMKVFMIPWPYLLIFGSQRLRI